MAEPTVSRRNLMLATGAGLALAACDRAGSNPPLTGAGKNIEGIDPPRGDDSNGALPTAPFAPKFVTLVRISSDGAWDFSANHASFDASGLTEAQRKTLATDIFKHFKGVHPPGNRAIRKFGELKDQTKDYRIAERDHNGYDRMDFSQFTFGGQHEIYIWFDSKDVSLVRKAADQKLHLISMSHQRADGTTTDTNKSFYAMDFGPTPAELKGPIIVVRNYFRNASGNPVTAADGELKYSMNIFFKAKNKQKVDMTIILDPDTGNGVGFDPIIGA